MSKHDFRVVASSTVAMSTFPGQFNLLLQKIVYLAICLSKLWIFSFFHSQYSLLYKQCCTFQHVCQMSQLDSPQKIGTIKHFHSFNRISYDTVMCNLILLLLDSYSYNDLRKVE